MNFVGHLIIAESLDDLYPDGTPLKAVDPDFRGLPFRRWQRLKLIDSARKFEASESAQKLEAFYKARAEREVAAAVAADEPQGALF